MALNERTEFGSINIDADGVIQVRLDRVILDGTDEIARRYSRTVYTPDMEPTTLPAKVRRIANVIWDAATVAAYKAKIAAQATQA
ncbi:hypothetical protein NKJ71_19405 [Mesorhizobium sp. M0050]|uniref:hypothetical protein n=1 Tax=Mesorhizobium sp. M0050 TaxID=2956861 RepID=UPI00333D57A3